MYTKHLYEAILLVVKLVVNLNLLPFLYDGLILALCIVGISVLSIAIERANAQAVVAGDKCCKNARVNHQGDTDRGIPFHESLAGVTVEVVKEAVKAKVVGVDDKRFHRGRDSAICKLVVLDYRQNGQ